MADGRSVMPERGGLHAQNESAYGTRDGVAASGADDAAGGTLLEI